MTRLLQRWRLLLFLLTLAVWSPAIFQPTQLALDDYIFIVESRATWLSAFTLDSYAATGYQGAPPVVFRPLGVMLLSLERALFGIDALWLWRLASVIAHALCVTLFARWLEALRLPASAVFLASLVWAVSPIHAEAVNWAVAQFDLFSAACLLAAFVAATRGRARDLIPSALLFGLAIGLKESALAAIPALLLTAWYGATANAHSLATPHPPEDTRHDANTPAKASAPSPYPPADTPDDGSAALLRRLSTPAGYTGALAVLAGIGVMSYLNLRQAVGVSSALPDRVDLPALAAAYGGALLRMVGLSDLLEVSGPPLHHPAAGQLVALGLLLLLLGAAISRAGTKAALPALLLLHPIPALLHSQRDVMHVADPDRYFYLSSLGVTALVLCAVLGHTRAATSRHDTGADGVSRPAAPRAGLWRPAIVAILLAALWLGVRSIGETRYYQSVEDSLTRHLELGRDSGQLRYFRALELEQLGRWCEAATDLERCVALAKTPGKRGQCERARAEARSRCPDPVLP